MNRVAALAARLAAFADGALIEFKENRWYFTGFPSSAGVLLVTKQNAVFLTDSRYIEAARNGVYPEVAVRELTSLPTQLPALLAELGVRTLAIEAEHTTIARRKALCGMVGSVTLEESGLLDQAVTQLRAVKSREEVSHIIAAQRIAEQAFETTLGEIRPGMTEREIALSLDFHMLRLGADALSFETIAVSGENSSKPHGVPGNRAVCKGDFITMDFGAVVNGYHSDMTRTVAVGSVTQAQRDVYETVLAAQGAMLGVIREGQRCADVDAAAREVIAQAGYGDFFRHGAGHSVGLEIHELPSLSPASTDTLAAGNVVTAEPGIYLPGRFGVRIEDMAYVTQAGHENLTCAPKALVIL